MGTAKIGFSSALLNKENGLDMGIFIDMMRYLPADARFMGCRHDSGYTGSCIFINSAKFKDAIPGMDTEEITPIFSRDHRGNITCIGMSMDNALKPDPTPQNQSPAVILPKGAALQPIAIVEDDDNSDDQQERCKKCGSTAVNGYMGFNHWHAVCNDCGTKQ